MAELSALTDRPDWHRHAACIGADEALFFPERGQQTSEAKLICAGCPVRLPCLDEALATPVYDDFGVRGGTSSQERAKLRRQRGDATRRGFQFSRG